MKKNGINQTLQTNPDPDFRIKDSWFFAIAFFVFLDAFGNDQHKEVTYGYWQE